MSAQAVATPVNSIAPSIPGALALPKMSVSEYFALERASEIRHEYFDGEIIEMAGETPIHNAIAGNVFFYLRLAVGNRPCKMYFENVRLRVSPTQYRYPDVMALCGEAQFDDDTPPALLNPVLVVEILSPSTQATDRTEKFSEYREIPELTDYVLISQDKMSVLHYVRQNARQWQVNAHTEPVDILTFTTLEVTLTLNDIYDQVTFPAASVITPASSPS